MKTNVETKTMETQRISPQGEIIKTQSYYLIIGDEKKKIVNIGKSTYEEINIIINKKQKQ